jgi:hypothetical protein
MYMEKEISASTVEREISKLKMGLLQQVYMMLHIFFVREEMLLNKEMYIHKEFVFECLLDISFLPRKMITLSFT